MEAVWAGTESEKRGDRLFGSHNSNSITRWWVNYIGEFFIRLLNFAFQGGFGVNFNSIFFVDFDTIFGTISYGFMTIPVAFSSLLLFFGMSLGFIKVNLT